MRLKLGFWLQETLEAAARQALTCRLQESLKLAHTSAASKMDELLATQRELQVAAGLQLAAACVPAAQACTMTCLPIARQGLDPCSRLYKLQACCCSLRVRRFRQHAHSVAHKKLVLCVRHEAQQGSRCCRAGPRPCKQVCTACNGSAWLSSRAPTS